MADVCTPNEEELAYARTIWRGGRGSLVRVVRCDCVVTRGKNGVIACVDGQILRVQRRRGLWIRRARGYLSAALAGRSSPPHAVARGARPRAMRGRRTLHAGDRRIRIRSLRGRPPGCVRSPTGPPASSRAKSRR